MTDAMRVWREARKARHLAFYPYDGSRTKCEADQAAAAVIERAIAEAVEQERAKAEALAEALRFYADRPCRLEFGVVNECPYDDGDAARDALRAWEDTDAPR